MRQAPEQQLAVHRPAGPLAVVAPSMTGYLDRGLAPAVHRGLPSPWLTVIITVDSPCRVVAQPDPSQPAQEYPALIGGLHVSPALIAHDGEQSGVQVALDPLAARAVLGLPAGELVMTDLHLDQVLGPEARRLHEQVGAAPDWPSRFALVERFLTGRLADDARAGLSADPGRQVRGAWEQLLSRAGRVRIDDLARGCGWSGRHLGEVFRREVGLSPKTAARVARFDATRRRLPAALARGRVADLASARGYADQAHLNRDFRQFAGLAPRAWWSAEAAGGLRNVQATAGSVTGGSRTTNPRTTSTPGGSDHD